jgi:hypothetical protein
VAGVALVRENKYRITVYACLFHHKPLSDSSNTFTYKGKAIPVTGHGGL